jgi:hypothetical protein
LIKRARPFPNQNYALFGWLAGVRNYSSLPVLSEARGLPDDVSADVALAHQRWRGDAHSESWIDVEDLLAFDYDQQVEDHREGEVTTFRALFGEEFFETLQVLKAMGARRVVFWFDN